MRILITGGAGYLGTVVTSKLLNEKYKIRVLDNFFYNQVCLLPQLLDKNLELINGDIRNEQTVRVALKDVDCIVHLAALVGVPICLKYPTLARSINVEGTRIINKLRNQRKQRLIFSSTTSLYGETKENCDENHSLTAPSLYSQTKIAAENILQNSDNYIIFRYATLFGLSQKMRTDLLPNHLVFQAIKNKCVSLYQPRHIRTFLHVRDAANAILHGIQNFSSMKNEVYNCGSENMNISKGELLNIISEKIKFQSIINETERDPDERNYYVIYDKIKATGYSPNIDMRSGIDELIKAYSSIPFNSSHKNIAD